MKAIALEEETEETGSVSQSWVDDEDTQGPALVPYHFRWPVENDTGALSGDTLGKMGGAAAAAGATGAALGSIIPGVGTAIGGAVGSVVGAIGGFFSDVFGKKDPKPLEPWQVEVMEKARRGLLETPPNYALSVDSVLMASSRYDYRRAQAEGRLPSQIVARNREAVLRKARELDAKYAAEIQKRLVGLTDGEKAIVCAALPTGHSKEALEAVIRIRKRIDRQRARRRWSPQLVEQLRRRSQPPSPVPQPIAPGEPNPSMPPASTHTPNERGFGEGMAPASLPTMDSLPRPAWHVPLGEMSPSAFLSILRAAPVLQSLPRRALEGIAGLGSKARDVSGVDATSREYVMLPGETYAGIAEQLTGNPERAVEIAAANPMRDPKSYRVALPPGFLSYTDMVVPAETVASDTSGPDGTRQNLTARVWEVRQDEYPFKIAKDAGATPSDPKWWKTLKSVNPHKSLVDGGANFQTFLAGELLNYPDSWPAHPRALPAPGAPVIPTIPSLPGLPGQPAPPPVVPQTGTMDPLVVLKAQGILAAFAARHPDVARPQDFGRTIGDVTGTMSARTTQVLASFQSWWNRRTITKGVMSNVSAPLNTNGVLDPATDAALVQYAQEEATAPLPPLIPGPLPEAPPAPAPSVPAPVPAPAPASPSGPMTPGQLPGLPVPVLTGPPATPIPIPPVFPPGAPVPGGPMTPGQLPGLPNVPVLTGPPATPIPIPPVFPPGTPVPSTPKKPSSSSSDDGGLLVLAIPAVGALASTLFR